MRLEIADTPPPDQRGHYKLVRKRLFGGGQRKVLSPSIPVPRISWTFGAITASGNVISFGFQAITLGRIIEAVCEFYNVNENDLKSACRLARIVYPRQVAMYLCRELTPKSFPLIGRVFGRDHTTALHAWRKISAMVEDDERMADEIAILIRMVRP